MNPIFSQNGYVKSSGGEMICVYCNYRYKTKIRFNEHILICGEKHKILNNVQTDEIPDNKILWKLIGSLVTDVKILKRENEEIKRKIHGIQRNRIPIRNIGDISVARRKPTTTYKVDDISGITHGFTKWYRSFIVEGDHLKSVFGGNLIDGIKTVLETNIKGNGIPPIRIFMKKYNSKCLCYYDDNDDNYEENAETDNETWKVMKTEDLLKMIKYINQSLLRMFVCWQKTNQTRIDCNTEFKDLEFQYMVKFNGHNISNERQAETIKKWLIQKLENK